MHRSLCLLTALAAAPALAGAPVPERGIQIRSIDLEASVIELHNFGAGPQALDGWRFCSHSNAQARRYTAAAGLNGVSLPGGGSVFIHLDNDAPGGGSSLDAADLGGSFASNFGQGPYAIQLFWPNGGSLSFGSIDDMADHAQWSVGGVGNPIAQTRSQQAVNAGLWTAANAFIVTSGNSETITLVPQGGELHGPADYSVTEPDPSCNPADIAAPFGVLDLADIGAFVAGFTGQDAIADLAPPAGVFDLQDIQAFVGAFTSGCP
jgi:hypothetical protein